MFVKINSSRLLTPSLRFGIISRAEVLCLMHYAILHVLLVVLWYWIYTFRILWVDVMTAINLAYVLRKLPLCSFWSLLDFMDTMEEIATVLKFLVDFLLVARFLFLVNSLFIIFVKPCQHDNPFWLGVQVSRFVLDALKLVPTNHSRMFIIIFII